MSVILKAESAYGINAESEVFYIWLLFLCGASPKHKLQDHLKIGSNNKIRAGVSRAVKTNSHTLFTTAEQRKERHQAKHELKQNKERAEGVVKEF